jgi:cell division protein FtsL
MTEWTIITVIVTLTGLFVTLGKPIISLNTAITKLQTSMENLIKEIDDLKVNNARSHEKIFDQLDDHETRISIIERQRK